MLPCWRGLKMLTAIFALNMANTTSSAMALARVTSLPANRSPSCEPQADGAATRLIHSSAPHLGRLLAGSGRIDRSCCTFCIRSQCCQRTSSFCMTVVFSVANGNNRIRKINYIRWQMNGKSIYFTRHRFLFNK